MGTWGYNVRQDDKFCEATEEFDDRVAKGEEPADVARSIIESNQDEPDAHIAVFAVAECLWRCGKLTQDIYNAVMDIGNRGVDDAYWASAGATPKMLEARRRKVSAFILHLSEYPKAKDTRSSDRRRPVPKTLRKGDVFWYRHNQTIYGAIVLDIQGEKDYYLIALSNALPQIPDNPEEVLLSELFTAAWFCDTELLPQNRMHIFSSVNIAGNYNGRAGFLRQENESVLITNMGQTATWKQTLRHLSYKNTPVQYVLNPKNLPRLDASGYDIQGG